MFSHLLTHLNCSSSENLLLGISYITCLEMRPGESSIDYMSRDRGISQQMQGLTTNKIISLFAIASLTQNCYPGVNSRYLADNSTLVNFNLLDLISILFSEETRHKALGPLLQKRIQLMDLVTKHYTRTLQNLFPFVL